MNIYLIGYRGSGKTTVAQQLAQRLGWNWLDADVELERRAGKSIKEIFAQSGEEAFRNQEAETVAALATLDRHVIALGGGAVLRESNRLAIRSGKVVWLQATVETLLARIESDPTTSQRRPNLTAVGGNEEVRRLLAQRTPLYAQCADLSLDASQDPPQRLAEAIAQWWNALPPAASSP